MTRNSHISRILQVSAARHISLLRLKNNLVARQVNIVRPTGFNNFKVKMGNSSLSLLFVIQDYEDNTLHHLTEIIDSIKDIFRNRITIHFKRVWQTIEHCSSNNEELKTVFRTFIKEGFNSLSARRTHYRWM